MKDYLFLEGEEPGRNAETCANACGLDALSGVHNLKGGAAPAAAPNLS
jgi:hypothetical protein